ncbi:MAG: cysteine desulfurase family protein [Anaerovoracaceae bacterium]
MTKIIYADNAATTRLSKKAYEAMKPYLEEFHGNPSGIYGIGRDAKRTINKAREIIGKAIEAEGREIYFTGSGTESDNWAIKGVAQANMHRGKHLITTSIEHHAVLNTMKYLEKQGFEITYLPVESTGKLSLEQLKSSIREDTILISVMAANNEIGTILPIRDIGKLAEEKNIIFHVDGVQAVGHIPISVSESKIDLLSFSAHKFHGPKGVGALYIKNGIKLEPLIHGGGQEQGLRGGTENVAGVVGMSVALEEAVANLPTKEFKLRPVTEMLIKGIEALPGARLTGDPLNRLPGIASFVFPGFEGNSLVHALDTVGIICSAGSACDSGSPEPSHVLRALGMNYVEAQGALRLSLSDENTEEEVKIIINELSKIIEAGGE